MSDTLKVLDKWLKDRTIPATELAPSEVVAAAKKRLPQHSSKHDSWGTPPHIIEAARKTFITQQIFLDPASTARQNEIVGARNYYSPEDGEDGLALPWKAPNIFVNPPGGKVGNKSNQLIWWEKCVEEYLLRHFSEGVFLGFTIELLRLSQQSKLSVFDFPFCVPSSRLRFIGPGDAPAHANVIVYLGEHHKTFDKHFRNIGAIALPHWSEEM